MRRAIAALGIATSLAAPAAADGGRYGKYEAPVYEVERAVGAAEIRRYAPQTLAVVTVEGGQGAALGRGFRALAGYIFGGNEAGQSIAMTAPVTQTAPVGGRSEVTFMVPRQYSVESLPRPNNAAVRFVEAPARRMIVLEFSGRSGQRVLARQEAALRQIASEAGLTIDGPAIYAFYDDPFSTLPWARRNEVAFVLEP